MATDLRTRLGQPVDPASFVVFRVGFGLVAALAAVRFVAKGWVSELLLDPGFHFAWLPGIGVPPAPLTYALFAAQVVAGLGIAWGRGVRGWAALWLLSFGWVEAMDKALYLNHYVLFTLLGATLLVAPPTTARGPGVPRWLLWLLRIEVGLVWFWAGVAKLNGDWLLRAEPLKTWLQALSDLPMVGGLLAWDPTAWAMSWGGAAYDLSVPFLLLNPRTRRLGMVAVVGFHVVVGWLFPIGIFPLVMLLGATLFLEPSWPRRWLGPVMLRIGRPMSERGLYAWAAVVVVLALFPARFVLYGTDVSWTEQGHRFAWRVLLNEKTGFVAYRVVERQTGRTWKVSPSTELTQLQHEQMRTQPDMILDYARHLRDQHAAEGRDVAVFAESWVSLNGSPPAPLIDPSVDLAAAGGVSEILCARTGCVSAR